MSGTEAESDRRQRESCVLMKAKPPTLTLAGREHIASAADNVRLPTKRVALVLWQPCSDAFRADLLPRGMAVGGGGGEAVPGDVDGGGA
jgi:hypothetical protein